MPCINFQHTVVLMLQAFYRKCTFQEMLYTTLENDDFEWKSWYIANINGVKNAWRFPKMISVNLDVAHVNAVIENPMEMTDTYKLLLYGIINIASIFRDGCITPRGPHCTVASGAHHLQGPICSGSGVSAHSMKPQLGIRP